jgi:hypothetical protein
VVVKVRQTVPDILFLLGVNLPKVRKHVRRTKLLTNTSSVEEKVIDNG